MSLQTVGSQAKYGLIQKKKPNNAAGKLRSVFTQEENEEDDGHDIKRANKQILGLGKATHTTDSLDSSLYDYDGEYDNFKSQREAEITALYQSSNRSSNTQSRYIDSLKTTAKVREREKERIFEKKLLKEREKEDADFSDKPSFITSAYKEKLKELEKWDYEDNLAREVEKHQDVKSKGMQDFYANLLTKNVAMGSNVESNAISAYTTGSTRQKHIEHSSNDTKVPNDDDSSSKLNNSDLDNTTVSVTATDSSPTISGVSNETAHVIQAKEEKSREDQINAAKARYMARKRSIHEVTTIDA